MNRQERRAAKSTGTNIDPQLAAGFKALEQGKPAAAAALFRQALRSAPDHPDAMRLLGEALIDLRQFNEAIPLLHRLVALQPGHFASHYTLANGLRLAGQIEPAIAAYRAALALNGQFAGALHGLGLALRQAQREAEALQQFKLAARAKPDWPMVW